VNVFIAFMLLFLLTFLEFPYNTFCLMFNFMYQSTKAHQKALSKQLGSKPVSDF